MLKIEDEKPCNDVNVLELLYEEAKLNILDGRYPCDYYEKLAAIQLYIEYGQFNSKVHTPEFIREKEKELLPVHYRIQATEGHPVVRQWFVSSSRVGRSSPQQRIIEKFRSIPSTERLHLLRDYLRICWEFPFYGAAFFNGQIERTTRGVGLLVSHHDKKVWVAINAGGLHVIDKKLCVSLKRVATKIACTNHCQLLFTI